MPTVLQKRKAIARHFSERSEPMGETEGWVDVFASGTHRGKKYPPASILKMAQNFKKLSAGHKPLLTVPAVVGHDEDQKFLNDSGWPAAGWPTKVRVVDDDMNPGEKKLQAIIGEIPPKLSEAINNKSYRKVSAEVYDDFVDPRTGEHHGPTLRRIAFLGGEIPQVKTLDDLPKVGYREEGGTFVAFMEKPAKMASLVQQNFKSKLPIKQILEISKQHGVSVFGMKSPYRVEGKTQDAILSFLYGLQEADQREPERHGETMSPELREADKPAKLPDKEKGQLQEDLIKKGFDAKLIKDIPDTLLAEIVRICSAGEPEETQPDPESQGTQPAGNPAGGEQPMPRNNEAAYGNAPEGPNPKPGEATMAGESVTEPEEMPGTPEEEMVHPKSGASGVQPEALDEEPGGETPGGKEFQPEQMEDEDAYGEFDEESSDDKMSSYADFHKQAARHYAMKYADTDDADAKKTMASKATFHRNMAKKYDDNRSFPERQTPKPAAQADSQARPVEASAKHSERYFRKFVEPRLQRIERQTITARRKAEKQEVRTFCEDLVRRGQLLPADKDARVMELLLLDNDRVRKFREGSNTFEATPRQVVMNRMARGPKVAKMGERFKEPGRNVGSSVDKFAERGSKLNSFWERFGEELESHGEKFAEWESLIKNPNLSDQEADNMLKVG